MSTTATNKPSDKTDKAPTRPDVQKPESIEGIKKAVTQKIGNVKGIEMIITHFKKSEWIPMIGAIIAILSESFGTSKEDVKADLKSLQKSVDQNKESESESAEDEEVAQEQEEEEPDVEITPYKPGTKKPTISPKHVFKGQIEQIYAQEDTLFTVNNLDKHFGPNYKKFLIERDPVKEGSPTISFLGRPISGGINLMMLPFLMIAEEKIKALDINYIPAQEKVRGFQDRNMCVADGKGGYMDDPNIPSFHKYGFAVDLDPDFNWPKHGRGTIPDEVIIAMAESGFACGMVSNPSFYYLMNDWMHYQMRFPPESVAGQAIINESPIGKRYWQAISPMLEDLKLTS